jgi:cytochrome c-type biogenesis protein CcmH
MKIIIFYFIIFLNLSSSYAVQKNIDQNQIYKNLRCLVCQGQSISDSNSDFAQTIKLVVKDLIKQGKSEREIYTFMADKYGDWIVYKPQLNKQNFILWVLPYVILLGGGLIIFSIIRKKRKKF